MQYRAFTWLAVAGGLTAAALGACSNDVVTTASGATGGVTTSSSSGAAAGAGGNTTVTTATNASSSSSGNVSVAASSSSGAGGASSGGTGGAGGATPCSDVCAKIDACNSQFVTCANVEKYAGIKFDCSDPQQACLGACLDPLIDCQKLFGLGSAVMSCMKMCGVNPTGGSSSSGGVASSSSGSSGVGGSSSGGSMQACNGCAQQSCMKELGSCVFDGKTQCGQWQQCLGGAASPQDVAACDAKYPAAAAAHGDIITCACMNCANECTLTDPCGNSTPDGGVAVDAGGH